MEARKYAATLRNLTGQQAVVGYGIYVSPSSDVYLQYRRSVRAKCIEVNPSALQTCDLHWVMAIAPRDAVFSRVLYIIAPP